MAADRSLSDFIFFLKMLGLWYDFGGDNGTILRSMQKFRLIFSAVGYLFLLLSTYQVGLKDGIHKYTSFVTGGLFINIQAISYFAEKGRIQSIVSQLMLIHAKRTEEWQYQLFDKKSVMLWTMNKAFVSLVCCFVVAYFLVPFAYDTFLAICTDSVEPFRFPFPFDSFAGVKRTPQYYVVFLLSFIWLGILASYFVGGLVLLLTTVHYCCIDIMVLRHQVEIWQESKEKSTQGLRRIIGDHRDLAVLSQDLRAGLGLPLAAQNAVSSLSITGFVFGAQSQLNKNPILAFMDVFCLLELLPIVWLTCYTGEMLLTESSKICDSFYDISWYEMNPKSRKDLILMIKQAQRPMVLNYKGTLDANLRTFQMVVNACYSCLMLLNSMN